MDYYSVDENTMDENGADVESIDVTDNEQEPEADSSDECVESERVSGEKCTKRKREDKCWLLTSRNLERASLRYRSEHGIESDRLEDTLAAMHTDSAEPWRLDKELQREIPQTFFDQFTAVCHGRTIYTAEFFAGLRRAAARK